MTSSDVHAELSLLGVSKEVHALVDDLGLQPRCPVFPFPRQVRKNTDLLAWHFEFKFRKEPYDFQKDFYKRNHSYVRKSDKDNAEKSGRLF